MATFGSAGREAAAFCQECTGRPAEHIACLIFVRMAYHVYSVVPSRVYSQKETDWVSPASNGSRGWWWTYFIDWADSEEDRD